MAFTVIPNVALESSLIVYTYPMNIQNPRLAAFAQTVFYSICAVVIPLIVSALGVDGALYSILPVWATKYGIAGAAIWILNYYDNKISTDKGGALFGTVA